LHSPIVPQALYEAGSGKPHGKWSLFNGAVEDKETLQEVQINRSSSLSKRQRVDRRIDEQNEAMKRHVHNMTEWGKICPIYSAKQPWWLAQVSYGV
jgi:hypothetical protein